MRSKEVFEMDDNSIKSKVTELEREMGLAKSGLSKHGGKGQNYKKLGVLRKAIARLKTVEKQRELGISVFKKSTTPEKPKTIEVKTEIKPKTTTETKNEEKPAVTSESKPSEKKETPKIEVKSESKPETKTEKSN